MLFIQRRIATTANPHMPAAMHFVSNARRATARADHHDIRDGYRRFLLRDSALDVALRIRPHVLLHHHYVFDQYFAGAGENPQHAALLALVTSGDHFHRVIALDIDSCMHCLPSTIGRPQPGIRRKNLALPSSLLFTRLSYRTSGARETIFRNFFSRSSRATGPNTRVPIGSPVSLISTAAF